MVYLVNISLENSINKTNSVLDLSNTYKNNEDRENLWFSCGKYEQCKKAVGRSIKSNCQLPTVKFDLLGSYISLPSYL